VVIAVLMPEAGRNCARAILLFTGNSSLPEALSDSVS
jgi:hypothetical protein